MVLFVAYAFYYRNVFSIIIYHHMPRERRCLRHPGAQQSHLPAEFLSNRRHRHRGMAASNPLHRDASTSRQPSSHSLHGITASNAALPSHKHEGLVGPLRPLRAAVALVAARRDLDPSHLRTPHTLMLGRRPPHAQGPCACGAVLGFVRRPPCGERQGSRIISARASKGVKSYRIRCPPNPARWRPRTTLFKAPRIFR